MAADRVKLIRAINVIGGSRTVISTPGSATAPPPPQPKGSGLVFIVDGTHEVFYDSPGASPPGFKPIVAGNVKWSEFTKDPTGVPDRSESTFSFDDGTRTFTIGPVGASFQLLYRGEYVTKVASDAVVIDDVEGLHAIYYTGQVPAGNADDWVLESTTSWSFEEIIRDNIFVAMVYWDATNQEAILIGDERHGLMPWMVHALWHTAFGTAFISGLGLGDFDADGSGNDDTAAQFSISSGQINDEDISHIIAGQTAPAAIPVFYKDGANGDWRRDAATDAPVKLFSGGSGRPAWNEFTGGVWQQTEVGNNNYFLVHIVATNDPDQPVIALQGQSTYGTLGQARDGANTEVSTLQTSGLPTVEFVFIGTIIYQTLTAYTNQWKARVRLTEAGDSYVDWRSQDPIPGAAPADHGNLVGRENPNQHPASSVDTDVSSFDGFLSASEDTVQKALDVLDNHDHDAQYDPLGAVLDYLPLAAGSGAPLTGDLYLDDALFIQTNDGVTGGVYKSWRSAINHLNVDSYAARGTEASPAALQANDGVLQFRGLAWDGDSHDVCGFFALEIDAAVSNGVTPSRWIFNAENHAGSRADVARFLGEGRACQFGDIGGGNYVIVSQAGISFVGTTIIQLPYLGGAPASPANGMIWMESDGLHIYYAGAEKVVAGA
jgi:hypothetical protein